MITYGICKITPINEHKKTKVMTQFYNFLSEFVIDIPRRHLRNLRLELYVFCSKTDINLKRKVMSIIQICFYSYIKKN